MPALTRGRATLDAVNSLYALLCGHFGGAGSARRDWLPREHIMALGGKVLGATGESKLQVLRALRLFRVTKHGVLPPV